MNQHGEMVGPAMFAEVSVVDVHVVFRTIAITNGRSLQLDHLRLDTFL